MIKCFIIQKGKQKYLDMIKFHKEDFETPKQVVKYLKARYGIGEYYLENCKKIFGEEEITLVIEQNEARYWNNLCSKNF